MTFMVKDTSREPCLAEWKVAAVRPLATRCTGLSQHMLTTTLKPETRTKLKTQTKGPESVRDLLSFFFLAFYQVWQGQLLCNHQPRHDLFFDWIILSCR